MPAVDPNAQGAQGVRSSDADRERTAALLGRHYVAGRLTPDELSERLGVAFAARTFAELAAVTSDLPGGEVSVRRLAQEADSIDEDLSPWARAVAGDRPYAVLIEDVLRWRERVRKARPAVARVAVDAATVVAAGAELTIGAPLVWRVRARAKQPWIVRAAVDLVAWALFMVAFALMAVSGMLVVVAMLKPALLGLPLAVIGTGAVIFIGAAVWLVRWLRGEDLRPA